MSNGSSEQVAGNLSVDEVDGHLTGSSDVLRTRAAIEHMQSKIGRTKDLIRGEQTTRDGMLCRNVLICAVYMTLGEMCPGKNAGYIIFVGAFSILLHV
jgi:hypothetical protein